MATAVGMVVPVWFSPKTSEEIVWRLLSITLDDLASYVAPQQVCLVVDGDARSGNLAARKCKAIAARCGQAPTLLLRGKNRGKGYTVMEGVCHLLEEHPDLHFVAVRDADGDHALSDLPHLVRAADHVMGTTGNSKVIIIGHRHCLYRPLGFVRGELELLVDRVLLDGLRFHLARRGEVLDLCYCSSYGDLPDFNSGYKVYSRAAAEAIFTHLEGQHLCLTPEEFWRYGSETIAIVEGVVRGAVLGEMSRTTWDGQPTSSFQECDLVQVYGAMLGWLFCRLTIPAAPAAQMLDNHLPRLTLYTVGQGRETLLAVRQTALARLADHLGQPAAPLSPPVLLPFL